MQALRFGIHWREYLMEASELRLYVFVARAFATLLQNPAQPVRLLITCSLAHRAVYGLLMWSTVLMQTRTNSSSDQVPSKPQPEEFDLLIFGSGTGGTWHEDGRFVTSRESPKK